MPYPITLPKYALSYYIEPNYILSYCIEPKPISIHWAEQYPILIHWAELNPILTYWAEPYLNTLSGTIPYLNTLSRTIPYLTTLKRIHSDFDNSGRQPIRIEYYVLWAANQIQVLRHPIRQRIRIECYVTRELPPRPDDPSQISARVSSL